MLVANKIETVNYILNGHKIVGDASLLSQCNTWLSVNWEGKVETVLTGPVDKLHTSWFEPSDKGGLGLFGVKGKDVVCGLAFYDKGIDGHNYPCYFVIAKKCCDTYCD